MRHPIHLLPLALMVAPAWSLQVSLPDSTAKLDIGVLMQNRAEFNAAEDISGKTFDVNRGKTGEADPVDLYGRRARLSFKLNRGSWTGFAMLSADNTDQTSTDQNRNPKLLYLWAKDTIAQGELTHTITVGLDKAHVIPAFDDPSNELLFPTARATSILPKPVSAFGVRYALSSRLFEISADVQNSHEAEKFTPKFSEGMFYGGRMVASLLGQMPKRTESYLGEDGQSLALGLDGTIQNNIVDSLPKVGAKPDTVYATRYTFGTDLLGHAGPVTAVVDFRFGTYSNTKTDVKSMVYTAQVGYAHKMGATIVEPAVRFAQIDKNTDVDEKANYSTAAIQEHGNSGYEVEAGVNVYFRKHSNKLQLSFTRWESEASDANANIVRLQHQFSF